jgi:hypothetical protein
MARATALLVLTVRSYRRVPLGAVENRLTARALAGLVSPRVVSEIAIGPYFGRPSAIDDLDGSRLEEGDGDTVTFAYQGAEYSIDLSQKHVDEFHDALAKYIAAAQKVSGRPGRSASPTRSTRGTTKPDKNQLGAIRAWAREHGHTVSDRGRISQEVIDAYNSAK